MVDKQLILRKLSQMDEYLGQLRGFSDIDVKGYANNWKTQRIVERTLQMLIEICVDIANHLVSDEKLRTPESYTDVFFVLGEAGILFDEMVATMQDMAKFRNVVVHSYDKVDAALVVHLLKQRLGDFDAFRAQIMEWLRRGG